MANEMQYRLKRICQSNEDGAETQNPPKEIVISDGALALIAGSDTITTALSTTFWRILTHPEVSRWLWEEIDEFYPPGEDSTSTEHHPQMI